MSNSIWYDQGKAAAQSGAKSSGGSSQQSYQEKQARNAGYDQHRLSPPPPPQPIPAKGKY